MIIIIIIFGIIILFIKIIMGAIFCQVKRINEFIQFNPSITSGNQKWKGAAPILIINAEFIIIINELFTRGISNSSFNIIRSIAINKIIEANACVIKYFIDDSAE